MKKKKLTLTEQILEKLKNFELKKSYVVIAVILAVTARYWGENTVTLLQKEVPVVTTTQISPDELHFYIQTKQQYLNENINIDLVIVEHYDFENIMDQKIHEWFLVRNWRPSRFFYVENRIKKIVSLINEQNRKLKEAEKLDEQAAHFAKMSTMFDPETNNHAEQAATLSKKAELIRYHIDKNIRNAGISKKEEQAVRDNFETIENLISQ